MAKIKKSKKFDRNRKWCQAYRNSDRRMINKLFKLLKLYMKGKADTNVQEYLLNHAHTSVYKQAQNMVRAWEHERELQKSRYNEAA